MEDEELLKYELAKQEAKDSRTTNYHVAILSLVATVIVGLMAWILITVNVMSQDIAVIKSNSSKDYESMMKAIAEVKQHYEVLDDEVEEIKNFVTRHDAKDRK